MVTAWSGDVQFKSLIKLEAIMKKLVFVIIMFLGLFFVAPYTTLAQTDAEYSKALKYYNSKKYAKAVEQLQDYVKKNPNPAAYYLMGYSLYKLGKFDEATQYFNEAYLLDPDFSLEKAGLIQKQPEDKIKEKIAQPAGEQVPSEQKPSAAEAKVKQAEAKKETAPSKQPSAKPEPVPAKQPDVKQPLKAIQPQKPGLQKVTPEKKASVTEQKTETQEVQPPAGMPPTPMPQKETPGVAPGLLIGLMAGFGMIMLVIVLAVYIFCSLCLFLIAKKLNVSAPWTAWVPLVNLWTVVTAAGKPWWWILLMFIPIIGPFIGVYLWMCITENLGKNKWLGLLLLVPIAGFVWMGILAFSKSESTGGPAVSNSAPEDTPPIEE